jgi:hypothetical protein
VARWAEFPAGAVPRPLVLLYGPVRAEGFTTGDAKAAFEQGAVEAAAGVLEEAVHLLRRAAAQPTARRMPLQGPLRVSAAELSEAEFATDRGRQRLPAWRLDAADALGPVWVLTAETQARCWSPPRAGAERTGPWLLKSGITWLDDAKLDVSFTGGSEQLYDYDVEVIETPAAVCVVPLQRMTRQLAPGTYVITAGHRRQVSVTLAGPLGGRVLVNLNGTPVPVTLAGRW